MTPEHFLEQFGYLADAPNGIAKLRELILQLAVRGKLVPQDPSDEPASMLLERIRAEKEQLVAEGTIKGTKPLPLIELKEASPELPAGWSTCRLGDLVRVINGRAYNKHELLESGTPVLRVGNLFTSNQWYYSDLKLEEDKYCDTGDLIYAWSASFGPFIWDGPRAIFHYHIWKLDFFSSADFNKRFLYTFLLEKTREIKASGHGIAMAHMTKEKMERLQIPVPPSPEQSRIVAKVDQLMALCDDLEAKRNRRTETHGRLVRAAHHPLTQTRDHTEFQTAWRRVRDNFDRLHATLDSVKALRQTILQLAVQGKLVPQDPSDEPASVLLEKIRAEKKRLTGTGEVRAADRLSEAGPEELTFRLPKGWIPIRLGHAFLASEAGWSPRAEDRPASGNEWGVLKVSAVSWGEFRPLENKALPPSLIPRPEYEVRPGDFLLSRANTAELVARSVVVGNTPHRLMMSDKIIRLRFDGRLIDSRFINLYNNSALARAYYAKQAGGTSSSMKNVSRKQIALLPLALPPRAEQSRIVAKVDQLMALCDELETKLKASAFTAQHFAEAIVAELAA